MKQPSSVSALLQSSGPFNRLDGTWRPTSLVSEQFLTEQLQQMEQALTTVQTLFKAEPRQFADKLPLYARCLRQMRRSLVSARFSRGLDHLVFISAMTEFYSAYGVMLRFLHLSSVPS